MVYTCFSNHLLRWVCLFTQIFKQNHHGMVGEAGVDHKYLDDNLKLKCLGKQGGKTLSTEFSSWDRGLPNAVGGSGTGPHRAQRSQSGSVGTFAVGGVGRFPAGRGYYTPLCRGGGYQQRGRGCGQADRGPGTGRSGRKPIRMRALRQPGGRSRSDAQTAHALSHAVGHKCHQSGRRTHPGQSLQLVIVGVWSNRDTDMGAHHSSPGFFV